MRRLRVPSAWVLCAGVAGSGCLRDGGSDRADALDLIVADDWRVDPAPVVEIVSETAGGAYRFDRITGLVRLRTGTIVVADGGSSEIRGYSADGRHLWTTGRPGDGPGDFRRLASIALDGVDTVLAYDNRAPSRYTWIGPDGTILDSRSVSFLTRCGPPAPGLARGRVVVADCDMERLAEGRRRRAQFLVIGDPSSGATERVADVPGGEIDVLPGGSWRGVALGANPMLAVRDRLIAYGTGERFEIHLFGADGARLRSIAVGGPRRAVSAADRKAYLDRRAGRLEAFARARGRPSPIPSQPSAPFGSMPTRTSGWASSIPGASRRSDGRCSAPPVSRWLRPWCRPGSRSSTSGGARSLECNAMRTGWSE